MNNNWIFHTINKLRFFSLANKSSETFDFNNKECILYLAGGALFKSKEMENAGLFECFAYRRCLKSQQHYYVLQNN